MMRKSAENVVNPSLRLSVAWTPFAKKLAAVLGTLEEDQFLVISVKRSNRFLQFAAQGTVGVRAETTSNSYLEKSEQLDMQQIAALRDAGWHGATGSPADSTPENDPDGSPNFFVDFPAPVPVNALADLAVRTLAEILRVPYPGFLEYEAFDADGKAITLPELGLKRVMRSQQPAQVAALPERLLATLKETTGIAELEFDEDGDIGIRYGTVAVFVRLMGNPPQVRIHSRLLVDVEETPKLLARLNEINSEAVHLHFFVHKGAVYGVADVPAAPFVSDHVASIWHYFGSLSFGVGKGSGPIGYPGTQAWAYRCGGNLARWSLPADSVWTKRGCRERPWGQAGDNSQVFQSVRARCATSCPRLAPTHPPFAHTAPRSPRCGPGTPAAQQQLAF